MGHMHVSSRLYQASGRLSLIARAAILVIIADASGCLPTSNPLALSEDRAFFVEVTNLGSAPIGSIDVRVSLEAETTLEGYVVPDVLVRRFWRDGEVITPEKPLPPGERAYSSLMLMGGGSDDDGPPPPPPPPPSKRKVTPNGATSPGLSLRVRVLGAREWPFQERRYDPMTRGLPSLQPGPIVPWERRDIVSGAAPDGLVWLAAAGTFWRFDPRSGETRETLRSGLTTLQDLTVHQRGIIALSGDHVYELDLGSGGGQQATWAATSSQRPVGVTWMRGAAALLASINGEVGAIDNRGFRPLFALDIDGRTSRLGAIADRVATVDASSGEVRLHDPSSGMIEAIYHIPGATRLCGADANDALLVIDDCGSSRTLVMMLDPPGR